MKYFFIESLRVDLGFRLNRIHFYALLPPVESYNSCIEGFNYKNL
jgi:hypothetical protein